jgi:hypothetical protein
MKVAAKKAKTAKTVAKVVKPRVSAKVVKPRVSAKVVKVVKPKVSAKVVKPRVSVKKAVKVANNKPRKYNIRGGVFLSTKLSPILEESKVELQRASLLSLPPSTRLSVSASQSLRPLPVLPLSLVSSSASGPAKKYKKARNLLTLPKPPLIEEAAITDREAKEAKEAKETEEKLQLRIAVAEAVRRSNNRRGNSSLSSFANLSPDEKLEIFASKYRRLKAEEDASGETSTRMRNENSDRHKRQNNVLNGVRSSQQASSSSLGLFN